MTLNLNTSAFLARSLPGLNRGITTPAKPKTNWHGPVSRGLTVASGIFDSLNLFDTSKQWGSSARALERQAVQVREQSFVTAIDVADQGKDVMAAQTTAFGKSGSALEGSPLAVLADTANEIDTNVERVIEQGRIQYAAYMKQARRMKRAEKSSKLGGTLSAIGGGFGVAGFLAGGPFGLVAAGFGLASQATKK